MHIDGMIFDLDGTLAETLPVCFGAFREVFASYLGRSYDDAEIYALFGPSEEGILQQLLAERWESGLRDYLVAYDRLHGDSETRCDRRQGIAGLRNVDVRGDLRAGRDGSRGGTRVTPGRLRQHE